MKDITKKILMYKLKKRRIKFDDVNLDEVINAYDFILKSFLESNSDKYDHPYSFIYMPNETYDRENQLYFEIFTNTIVLIRLNIFKYLDYAYLLDWQNTTQDLDKLSGLSWCLRTFMGFQFSAPFEKEFIDKLMYSNRYLVESVTTRSIDKIIKSKYITKDYKGILIMYSNIFTKYHNIINVYEPKEFNSFSNPFLMLMNKTYFYFLKNDLFNKEPDKVLTFLKNINNNVSSFSDEVILNGIINDDEIIKYIDYLYHNNDVKENKTIK